MPETVYECVKCGGVFPKAEWELIEGEFRCPNCRSRLAKKIRPPIAKRVKAI